MELDSYHIHIDMTTPKSEISSKSSETGSDSGSASTEQDMKLAMEIVSKEKRPADTNDSTPDNQQKTNTTEFSSPESPINAGSRTVPYSGFWIGVTCFADAIISLTHWIGQPNLNLWNSNKWMVSSSYQKSLSMWHVFQGFTDWARIFRIIILSYIYFAIVYVLSSSNLDSFQESMRQGGWSIRQAWASASLHTETPPTLPDLVSLHIASKNSFTIDAITIQTSVVSTVPPVGYELLLLIGRILQAHPRSPRSEVLLSEIQNLEQAWHAESMNLNALAHHSYSMLHSIGGMVQYSLDNPHLTQRGWVQLLNEVKVPLDTISRELDLIWDRNRNETTELLIPDLIQKAVKYTTQDQKDIQTIYSNQAWYKKNFESSTQLSSRSLYHEQLRAAVATAQPRRAFKHYHKWMMSVLQLIQEVELLQELIMDSSIRVGQKKVQEHVAEFQVAYHRLIELFDNATQKKTMMRE